MKSLARGCVRARYVLLVMAVCGAAVQGVFFDPGRYWSDWIIFEIGARTLTHWHHLPFYSGNPLHLYQDDPVIQIGPPPLLLITATQWLSPHAVSGLWVYVMSLMGVGALGFTEATARRLCPPERAARIRAITLVGGLPLMGAWGYVSAHLHHLDDALALLCVAAAMWLCASGRSAWLVGIALGLAAASKPWAIVACPLLLGLPRPGRAKAILGLVVTAVAFWGPFVVAAPGTIHSLGTLHTIAYPGSIPWLFHMHGYMPSALRTTQFLLGIGLAGYVALRGRWAAAPLVGFAVRVGTDPYVFSYYGLGPVLAALAWDLIRQRERPRLPVWTAWTLFVEFGLRLFAPQTICAIGRLLWVLSVLAVFVTARRVEPEPEPVEAPAPALAGV